jgi:signal transduction histidine kinase
MSPDAVAHTLASLGPPTVQIRVMIPAATPLAVADPALLERVLANLLSNAIRYSPADSPAIVTASALGDRVELRVIDQGPGLSPTTGTGSSPPSSGRAARAPHPVPASASRCPAA